MVLKEIGLYKKVKYDIFLINNISGEKFKINLSKIEGDL
jgi:hypothetical protein